MAKLTNNIKKGIQPLPRKIVPFFCDECGIELSTGNACPVCKRILCHIHYFGNARGLYRRKDGLCVRCAAAKEEDEK